jgi:hypothetical protein
MQYIKRRIRVILNNLLDLASSLIELKTLKSVLLVREAEVKLRFPYLTTFLMTLKVALQLSILYMLLNALCFEHGLLKYLNKDMVFKIYLVFATARYLYYLIGIMDSLISGESYIIKHLKKRMKTAESDLWDIEAHRKRVLLWGDQYISKDKIKDV